MFTIFLLVLCIVLIVAVFVLFHARMVDLNKWHMFTHQLATQTAAEFAAFKAYVETHLHLHTAPAASVSELKPAATP
jgi:hypothetical protein